MKFDLVATENKERLVREMAKIIFERLASQISGISISQESWEAALQGFRCDPHLFPLVEACFDAAIAIHFLCFETHNESGEQ